MSEALEQLIRLRSDVEAVMCDGMFDAQLCRAAKDAMDDAFTALDKACSAQGKQEDGQ